MTKRELTTRAFWSAAKRLREPDARLTAADRAMLECTLGHIAAHADGRVAQAAAERLHVVDGGPGNAA